MNKLYIAFLLTALLFTSCRKPTRQLVLNIYGGSDFIKQSSIDVSFKFKKQDILFKELAYGSDGEIKKAIIDIKDGTTATINANISSVHNFGGFKGDINSGNKTVSIKMDGNRDVSVYFYYKPDMLNRPPDIGDVYEVSHNSHLRWLADKNFKEPILYNFEGKTIKLTKNIYLSDYDFIGFANNNTSIFEGVFDGDGKSIHGLNITATNNNINNFGFIGNLGNKASIKNINIDGKVGIAKNNTTIAKNIGGVVGISKGTIENINSRLNVFGMENTAIVVGYNEGTMENIYSSGEVSGTKNVAGIAGYNTGTISEAYNFANITAIIKDDYSSVGGIVGINDSMGEIDKSANTTNIYVSGNNINYSYIGGVIGSNGGHIDRVYNVGAISISASVDKLYTGGVIGLNSLKLLNAYNTGEIRLIGLANDVYAGGVVGYNSSTAMIDSVYNIALVINEMNGIKLYTGGVLAFNNNINDSTITKYHLLKNSTINANINTIAEPISTDGEKDIVDFKKPLDFDTKIWELGTSLANVNGITTRPVLMGVGRKIISSE